MFGRFERKIKTNIRAILSVRNVNKYKNFKNEKKIIYLLTPLHGNMGDQAIAYATLKYYKEYFPDYKILEFDRDRVFTEYFAIKSCLNKDDLIVLHGGGNLGNLYIIEEEARRFAIKKFKYNKIISMTQTISFSNDNEGKREEKLTKKIYNSNKNLILLAREETSYRKMIGIFKAKVIKIPDIVFYLQDSINNDYKRHMILTCLRNDKESIWKEKKKEFENKLQQEFQEVKIYDTSLDEFFYHNRDRELKDMWDNFKRSKVVITDRLHGMIFCVITKTPCIALKSLDHKVVDSYKWIEELEYIKLVEDLNYTKIKPYIYELSNMRVSENFGFKEKYFDNLKKQLDELLV